MMPPRGLWNTNESGGSPGAWVEALRRAVSASGCSGIEQAPRIRDELLAITEFCTLTEAQLLIEDWRIEYNDERPHSSLGYLTPVEFHRAWTERLQPKPAL